MKPISRPEPVTTPAQTAQATPAWRVGQMLKATVVANPAPGEVTLRVGRQQLEARVPASLPSAKELTLRVEQLGRTPVLKVMNAGPADDVVAATQRADLPRQTSLAQLASALASVVQLKRDGIDPGAAAIAQRIVDQWLDARSLTSGDGLKNALRDSGVFLESKLANADHTPLLLQGDLKANLLALRAELVRLLTRTGRERSASAMRPAPKTPIPSRDGLPSAQPRVEYDPSAMSSTDSVIEVLLDASEAALARVRLNQLASTPTQADDTRVWLLEIPIRDGADADILHLRIERERARNRLGRETRWTVRLAIDIDGLGPLHVRLSGNERQLDTTVWVEREATRMLLQAHLPSLRQQLEDSGITLGRLELLQGRPKVPEHTASEPVILDEKA